MLSTRFRLKHAPFAQPTLLTLAIALSSLSPAAHATDAATLQALQQQIDSLRQDYETRLQALEARLTEAQAQAPTTPAVTPSTATTGNRFNPSVSVILSGTYASLQRSPDTWSLGGFQLGEDGHGVGPGERGFSLGESEISLRASVDPWVTGALTLGIEDDHGVGVEEAFVQSTALPYGLTLKGGRFFSSLGYQNEQHAHARDFVDAPYVHQAFLNGQYTQDGAQLQWLLPTDHYMALGAEVGNGRAYPGAERDSNAPGSVVLFARTGGDIGDSHSWRLGLSWLRTKAEDRLWGGAGHDHESDEHADETRSFSGTSRLWVVDGVWKWSPNGNASSTSLKLQGEYFQRTEDGNATLVEGDVTEEGAYRSSQSGWYVQGVYQFMPRWRIGLRHDQLDSGTVRTSLDELAGDAHRPRRHSLMLDWSPSEFQRWRLQLNDDRARPGVKDTQLYLQYQMSLGAHGAHSF